MTECVWLDVKPYSINQSLGRRTRWPGLRFTWWTPVLCREDGIRPY